MQSGEAPSSRPGPWKRPWVRRITYLIATGAVLAGVAAWTVRRPFVTAWVLRELDRLSVAETGLPLEVGDLEISLLSGKVVLHRIAWGGDFLRVKRIEVVADPWSLQGRRPHLRSCVLEEPRMKLSPASLARLKLRPRPPSEDPVKVQVGTFTLSGGQFELPEKAWGLPAGSFLFSASGQGLGPNHVAAVLQMDRIAVATPHGGLQGRARIEANVSEALLSLKRAELDLGRNRLTASGSAAFKRKELKASAEAHLDLSELSEFIPDSGLGGSAELKVSASGSLTDPLLELEAQGRDLSSSRINLQAGSLKLKAKGGASRIQLTSLDWESPEGQLHADGEWRKGAVARLRMAAQDLDLGPAATSARIGFLKEFRTSFEGEATLPADLSHPPRLDKLAGSVRVSLARNGQPAGRLALDLAEGNLEVSELDLKAPELDLVGKGRLRLGARGIENLQGSGRLRTDAAEVAKVLKAWNLAVLDMGGRTEAQATISWDSTHGLSLDGTGEITTPRWQKAHADKVRSDVRIRGSELFVRNTELAKGDGRGWGELWLDWGKVKPGADTFDLCYRGFRLPIAEGLRAADDGKNKIGDLPISGLGSAWVRLRGDWEHLKLTGEGLLEEGRAYGLRLPAGRASIEYDVNADRLRIPEFRLAESTTQLGEGGDPEGFLALKGALDMDLARLKWNGRITGSLDSTLLELPGPRFQASVEGRVEGPWSAPFGPLNLPFGWVNFSQGRLFVGDQSVEDLRGVLRFQDGRLSAEVGSAGHDRPIFILDALNLGPEVRGNAALRIAPESGDTARLAQRLTGDLLQNAVADIRADGILDTKGLRWQGQVQELTGYFQGFTLAQTRTGTLSGDTREATLDLFLQGRRAVPGESAEAAAKAGPTASFQLSGKVPFSLEAPADLKLKGTGELANLKTILDHLLDLEHAPGLLAELKPEGRASVDLRATGTYTDPKVDGTLDLVDGKLSMKAFPHSIEDVIFTLRFKGRDIELSEEDPLIGSFAQGSLGLWGKASWGLGGLSSYDFSARLDDFSMRDVPEGFDLQGSLEANLSGNDTSGGILRGTLQAERMAYHTDITVRDLILGGSIGAAPELSGLDPDDPLSRIDLDLDLILAQPWDFNTNLLKIKGRPEGAFKVVGTLLRPGLLGRMEFLPGGRLTNLLPAGDVVLERGSIHFVDPTVVNPVINLEGRIDVPPYLVTLAINGTLDQLNFVPTSTPSLRQDEIVAILIDPASAHSVGTSSAPTSQASLNYGLASASSGLLATLAFANFGETLRKTLKLDRVNPVVRTGSTGTLESSLTIGKTFEMFGSRTPIIGTYTRSGSVVTLSSQVEWRFGNFVLQFGVSSSDTSGINPTGEIRHTWSPR